jgi:penicillin-binding protein 1A
VEPGPGSARLWLRLSLAVASLIVVGVGLLVASSAIALAIDWKIPEGHELKGPTVVYDRDGEVLTRLAAEVEHRPRALDQISPHLREAVIATEDRRFYEHQGVDPLSVLRAVISNVRSGGIRQGGSTLTQQYVKTVYLDPSQTLYRKVREALISLQLEKERTKDEILEAYLNQVYFGEGAYGAEAAARTYFGKTAAELNRREAATLASILSAPSALSPRKDPEAARVRRDAVLDEMLRYGFITARERDRAAAGRVRLVKPPKPNRVAPYFIEEVREQLLAEYGADRVYKGGLRVTTTLDRRRQAALVENVRRHLPPSKRLDAGVAAVDPATGDVFAAYSGRSFRRSQVDLALGRGTDGRPSGSTFKVFALATALEEGKTLATTYPAPGQVTIGGWSPSGSGGCGGSCSLLQATARSSNTVFAQLARDVGAEDFTQMARRLGVRQRFRDPSLPEVLGTSDVTPLDMASALATLANDGVACPARVVTRVRDPEGRALPPPDPRQPTGAEREAIVERLRDRGYRFGDEDLGRCYRALAPSIARTVTQALEAVVEYGTGTRADIGRPQAGKTGTSQDNQEAWFIGYTPDLAMAVAFFDRDAQRTLAGIPGCASVCFGGDLPAAIWRDAARVLLRGVKPRDFPEPGPDERRFPDRRRLQPPITSTGGSATGGADGEGDATESPAPTEPPPAATPPPPEEEQTEPPPEDDPDDDGGILPLPPPPGT